LTSACAKNAQVSGSETFPSCEEIQKELQPIATPKVRQCLIWPAWEVSTGVLKKPMGTLV